MMFSVLPVPELLIDLKSVLFPPPPNLDLQEFSVPDHKSEAENLLEA